MTIQIFSRKRAVVPAILCFLSLLGISCVRHPVTFGKPDLQRFRTSVHSQSLLDSIRQNVLAVGMPHFVVREIFLSCDGDTEIPVASIGSRQKLDEHEGLFSHFHDPGIEVYLDRYKTERGTLLVWYGNPTFYRFGVMAKDTLYAYGEQEIDTSRVLWLLKPFSLRLEKRMHTTDIPYAEIHHREQKGQISYWYNLTMIDSTAINLNPQKKNEYPIFRLEFDDKQITSFKWN
ncbi:MAG: hypothetical protein HY033_09580 [Ignavibacteriae bacterium]|nr:hypothetical protein [Ignavibacteriota bacterium]